MANLSFIVIDNLTGKEADTQAIVLNEDWAKHLLYCDISGFAILEDGNLILMDDCDKVAYCSPDRFTVKFET